MARMRDSASRLRWPPLSSDRLSFHTSLKATLTSRPADALLEVGSTAIQLAMLLQSSLSASFCSDNCFSYCAKFE